MDMLEPANGSDTLAARRLIETKQQPQNNRGAQRSYSDAASFKRPSPTPMEVSSLNHMRPVEDEVERGRTLKRKRRFDSGCSVSRGRERRKVANIRQWDSDHSDEVSEEGEDETSSRNDVWNDWIQELIMAKIKNPPVIRPPDRSTSQSSRANSKSPVRKQILALKHCSPALEFISEADVKSDRVWELRCTIHNAGSLGFVNEEIRSRLDDRDRRDLRKHSGTEFNDLFGGTDIDQLFNLLESIQRDSLKCERKLRDESAWTRVATRMLEDIIKLEACTNDGCKVLEVLDIRTQSIREAFLPAYAADPEVGQEATPVPSKKTDLILSWDDEVQPAKALRDRFADKKVLNHLHPASTEMAPLQCAIEVKQTSAPSASDEAKLQLSVCHAAAIGHLLSNLAEDSPARAEIPLQVGWVVQGHRWECYISEYDHASKCINFAGPIGDAILGTNAPIPLLRLVAVVRCLLRWMVTEYWQAFSNLIGSTETALVEDQVSTGAAGE